MRELSIDFVREEFKKEGFQLLTTEYVNNRQRLEYICPSGHEGNISWNQWQHGIRCRKDAGIGRVKNSGTEAKNWI
jgi:hypothetical protein